MINVKGYDERLVIYGADDSDLYQRIIGGGVDCNKCPKLLDPSIVNSPNNEVETSDVFRHKVFQAELLPDLIDHKDHSNTLRVGNQLAAQPRQVINNGSDSFPGDVVSSFVDILIPKNPALRIKLNVILLQKATKAWHNIEDSSFWQCDSVVSTTSPDSLYVNDNLNVHVHCDMIRQSSSFSREEYKMAEKELKKFMEKTNKSYTYLPEENNDQSGGIKVRDESCHLTKTSLDMAELQNALGNNQYYILEAFLLGMSWVSSS